MSDDTRLVLAYRLQDGNVLCVPCAHKPEYATVPLEPVFDQTDIGDSDRDDDGEYWWWYECKGCGWDCARMTPDGPRPLERSGG